MKNPLSQLTRICIILALSSVVSVTARAQSADQSAGEVQPRFIWGALVKILGSSVFSSFGDWLSGRLTGGMTGAIPANGFAPTLMSGIQPGVPGQPGVAGQVVQGAMIGAIDAFANMIAGGRQQQGVQQGMAYGGAMPAGYPVQGQPAYPQSGQPAYPGLQSGYPGAPQYPQQQDANAYGQAPYPQQGVQAYPQQMGQQAASPQYPQANAQFPQQYPQAGPQSPQQYPQVAGQYPAAAQPYPQAVVGQPTAAQSGYPQQPVAQPMYPQQPPSYPQQVGGFPQPPQAAGFPQQAGYPPQPAGYPPQPYTQQGMAPVQPSLQVQQPFPGQVTAYPPAQTGYPQTNLQPSYPPQAAYPPQSGYPQPPGSYMMYSRSVSPITEQFVASRDVVLGRPTKPLEVQGKDPNYEGVHVAIVVLDSNGKPTSVRAVGDGFKTGEKFKLRVVSTFEGLVAIDNINPKGEQKRVYPDGNNVVAIPLGQEVLLPLGADEWFELSGNTGKEQLVIAIRDRRAFGEAATGNRVFRQDEKYGSNFVQEVSPGKTFPVITQSITFSHSSQ